MPPPARPSGAPSAVAKLTAEACGGSIRELDAPGRGPVAATEGSGGTIAIGLLCVGGTLDTDGGGGLLVGPRLLVLKSALHGVGPKGGHTIGEGRLKVHPEVATLLAGLVEGLREGKLLRPHLVPQGDHPELELPLEEVLDGDLDEFVQQLALAAQEESLQSAEQ